MINAKRFDLLIKSYLRTSNYEYSHMAKMSKISPKRLKALSQYPIQIPELSEVEKIIKNLKIPKDQVWQAYMNTVLQAYYHGQEVVLMDYLQYEEMIKNNKKHRGNRSIPSEEVFWDVFKKYKKPQEYSLNSLNLKSHFSVQARQEESKESLVKVLVKKFQIKPSLAKKILAGQLPNSKELNDLIWAVPNYQQPSLIERYLISVIEKYRLNYKIEVYSPPEYQLLLDQIYHR